MLFAKRQRERRVKDTACEIRGNAGGGLGDGETTEESGRSVEEGSAEEGQPQNSRGRARRPSSWREGTALWPPDL